jgi:hypothetical protein
MKFNFLFVVLLSASAITACAASPNAVEPIKQAAPAAPETPAMTEPAPHEPAPTRISTTGTVRHLDLEGGFWGIIADDGRKFDPMGLDAAFQKEGLRVRIEATPETDMMSTRMWGTMVTLTKIEPIE